MKFVLYTMVYFFDIPWFFMVNYQITYEIMGYQSVEYHDILWDTSTYHDITCAKFMVYHGIFYIPWYCVVYLKKYTMVYYIVYHRFSRFLKLGKKYHEKKHFSDIMIYFSARHGLKITVIVSHMGYF